MIIAIVVLGVIAIVAVNRLIVLAAWLAPHVGRWAGRAVRRHRLARAAR